MADAILSGILTGGMFTLVALGLSLVFGVMRLVNLAHGGMVLLGGYTTYVLTLLTGWDPFVALVVVVPVMFAVGYAVQRLLVTRLLLRGQEPPLVATFGLLLLIEGALTLAFTGNPVSIAAPYATSGIVVAGLHARVIGLLGLFIAVALVLATAAILRWTRLGAAVRAASADPRTAATVGIDVRHIYGLVSGYSAAIGSVAGAVVAVSLSLTPTAGFTYLAIGFTAVVLGGIGSIVGTLAGGILIGVTQSLGGYVFGSQYQTLTLYLVFLVILAILPKGLFGRGKA